MLSGKLLSKLAGGVSKGQYAQAAGQEILSIGEVTNISGSVKATRVDGNVFELNTGDPVFQGDTIETSVDGSVGLVFIDKTTFSLSEGGKMVLDELVYDPSIGSGSMSLEMLEGAFSFISGEVAKTGPDAMELKTPVVTMGIRGTTVAGKAAVEGNDNSFTLLEDSDGGVGQISISNDGGTQVLSQVGATTVVSSFTAPPPPPIILTAAQIQANYGTALNVLPPTPLVAPQPQSAPPPQEESQDEVTQEEEGDEDTSEEEANEETSEDGDSESDGEENSSEEGALDEETSLEEETLEDESPSEGEEPLEGDGPSEGDGPPEGEEGTTELSPDGETISAEQETAGEEAFEQALEDGATPEEAMAAAAAAAGLDGPGEPGPGGPEVPGGPEGPGDLGPGGPEVPGGPEGPGELIPGGPDGSDGLIGDLSTGGSTALEPSVDFGPNGTFSDPFGGPVAGFNSSPFAGVISINADPYGVPGGFGPASFGITGGFGPDPFGGPEGFGPDPLGGPIIGPDLFGGPQFLEYEDFSVMEFMEPIFFFDDPSLYNDFLEKEIEEETTDNSSGQIITGDWDLMY